MKHLPSCNSGLELAWDMYLSHARGQDGAGIPLAVDPDGTALVARDQGGAQALLVEPAGGNRPLVAAPTIPGLAPHFGAFSGRDAVVGWVRGANTPDPVLRAITVIDPESGHLVHRITVPSGPNGGTTSSGMAVAGGRVYWDEESADHHGVIRSYDLATHSTRTVYSGAGVIPLQSAGGVSWRASLSEPTAIHIAAPGVPQAVLAATTPVSRATLATDGTRWAWWDPQGIRFGWYDGTTIRFVSLRIPAQAAYLPVQVSVAGDIVFFTGLTQLRDQSVLDVRTGGIAELPDFTVFVGGYNETAVGAVGKNARVAQVLRFSARGLPKLTC